MLVDGFPPQIGGAETLYGKIVDGLGKGHQVSVLSPGKEGRLLFVFRAFLLVVWKILRHEVDLLITSTYASSWVVRVARWCGLRVPTILIVHEVLGERWGQLGLHPWTLWLHRIAEGMGVHANADALVGVSTFTTTELQHRFPKADITTIYNGVEPLPPSTAKDKELVTELLSSTKGTTLLYMGRPGILKGIYHLLRAFAMLAKEDSDVTLVLILSKTPKSERKELESYLAEASYGKQVVIHDSIPRTAFSTLLSQVDVAVVPSLTEGFGIMAAEYSLAGVPLVVNRVDALPEVVHGKVRFTDATDAEVFAEDLRQALAGNLTSIPAKTFTWEETQSHYNELATRLLSHHNHA